MPSEHSHKEQAEHNEKAADSVRETYSDWAVTMCFYSALHWVERYAKSQGDDLERQYPNSSSPHERRLRYIKDLSINIRERYSPKVAKDLRKAYEELERASKTARYLEGIKTNARTHYTRHNKRGVTNSFENLQTVKQLLDDRTK